MPARAWSRVSYSLSQTSRSFSFPNQALDEGLGFGVAVAAAAVTDLELAEAFAEAAGGERRPVIRAERQLAGLDVVSLRGLVDDGDRFVGAAAQAQLPADDLAGAAVDDRVQVRPAVLGDPDRGHVELPELPWPLDDEEAGPLAPCEWAAALDQLPLPHHPQHPFAVHRPSELLPGQRSNHAVPVGLIGLGDLDDRPLDRIGDRSALRHCPRSRRAVDRLAADLQDTRHRRRGKATGDELARPGDALVQLGRLGARCRPFDRSVSPSRPPNRTCALPRIRLSTDMPVLIRRSRSLPTASRSVGRGSGNG